MTPESSDAVSERSTLYARHYLELVRLAVQLVDDLETAEDVVQDVFAAWSNRSAPDDAVRYLRRAVVNRARSALRRRRTARAYDPPPASLAEAADADLLRAEHHRAMLSEIDRLPPRQREVVVLRYYLDLPVAEIASTLRMARIRTPLRLLFHRARQVPLGTRVPKRDQEHQDAADSNGTRASGGDVSLRNYLLPTARCLGP